MLTRKKAVFFYLSDSSISNRPKNKVRKLLSPKSRELSLLFSNKYLSRRYRKKLPCLVIFRNYQNVVTSGMVRQCLDLLFICGYFLVAQHCLLNHMFRCTKQNFAKSFEGNTSIRLLSMISRKSIFLQTHC